MPVNDGTIFVSIASYRDPELLPTLTNLIASAETPARLHITICWQEYGGPDVFQAVGLTLTPAGDTAGFPVWQGRLDGALVDVIAVAPGRSEGAGWARSLCESRFMAEDYFLQIDSHCRFIPGWDEQMITMLESLRQQSLRPLLSTYPPDYQPGEPEQRAGFTSRLVFKTFTADGIPLLDSYPFRASEPQRSCYLAGGFVFTDGHYVRNVPNDPQIFFYGEEISMAVRAFTHGYDAYTPHNILLWHHYGRAGSPRIWDDHTDHARKQGEVTHTWYERDRISKQRVCAVLGLREPLSGGYGCGTQRTLQDFEYASGLCFREQRIHREVKEHTRCSYFSSPPSGREKWLASLVPPEKRK